MTFLRQIGWIGVDLGTRSVKLAQVVRAADGVRLRHAAVIQRPTPWPEEDEFDSAKPSTSITEIGAALQCGSFAGRNAAGILPMNVCQLRSVNVPPGNDQERRTMIASELAEEWEDRPHPMEYDFWELDVPEGEASADGLNVGVLAVSRPWIGQLVHDFQTTNLYCWAIDGMPLAMARAVGMAVRAGTKRRFLAVDWGFSSTTLCIVGEGRPLYARRVRHCAFRKLLDSVGRAMDVTPDQAQHLVDIEGVVAPEDPSGGNAQLQEAITQAASDTIDELVSQVRRTLNFLSSQRPSLSPAACWLLGGGASIGNIAPYLSKALALPVHIWQLPTDGAQLPCTDGSRSAVFGGAAALSALAWEAA